MKPQRLTHIKSLIPLLLCICGLPTFALAQASLGISPTRAVLGNGERSTDIVLANTSDRTRTFKISTINKAMTINGTLVETNTPAPNEFFADSVIKYAPHTVTIKAGDIQKVRILSRLNDTHPDGEYRSHLLFRDITEESQATPYSIIMGASIPVILRKGKLSANITISNAHLECKEDNAFVNIRLNREGNHSVVGTIEVFDDERKVGVLENITIYLSTTHRNIAVKTFPELCADRRNDLRIVYNNEDGHMIDTFTLPAKNH